MAYYQKQHTSPALLVSLEEAKAHLKIEPSFNLEDALITTYVESAVSYVESYLGYSVVDATYIVKGQSFEDVLTFRKQKIKEISKVEYYDNGGVLKELSKKKFTLSTVDDFENRIEFKGRLPDFTDDKSDAVSLTVVVGLDDVPKSVKQAVLLLLGDFYEFRSNRPKTVIDTVGNLLCVLRNPC